VERKGENRREAKDDHGQHIIQHNKRHLEWDDKAMKTKGTNDNGRQERTRITKKGTEKTRKSQARWVEAIEGRNREMNLDPIIHSRITLVLIPPCRNL